MRGRGIAVDIVNGVSAAFAAAASLRVSLTPRGLSHGLTLATAHLQHGSEPDWRALAAAGTALAIYMGMSRLESLCAALSACLPPDTPAAAVQWAGTKRGIRVLSRLERLAEGARAAGLGCPAVILISEALREAVGEAALGPEMLEASG